MKKSFVRHVLFCWFTGKGEDRSFRYMSCIKLKLAASIRL